MFHRTVGGHKLLPRHIHYISGLQSHPDKIAVIVDDTPVSVSVTSASLTTSHRRQTRSTAVHECQTHWIITHTGGTTNRQTADYYCATRRYRGYRLYQHCTDMTTSDYRLASTSAPPPFVSLSAPVGTRHRGILGICRCTGAVTDCGNSLWRTIV